MQPDATTAVIFFAHGSPIESANEAVRETARAAALHGGFTLWSAAFLESAPPDLAGAVLTMVNAGAQRVLIVPYFLTLGLHLQRDLPRLTADVSRLHPGVEILCADPLDRHPAVAQVLADRALEVLKKAAR